MSRRQLHEAERGVPRAATGADGEATIRGSRARRRAAVRTCGMEALDEPQPRTRVKLRKAIETRVSVPSNVTPDIQSWSRGTGDGSGGTLRALTQGDLPRSRTVWREPRQRRRLERDARDCGLPPVARRVRVVGEEETTTQRSLGNEREKSDHLVVARKPGNAGGAKGVTA